MLARRSIFYSTVIFCAVTIIAIFFIRQNEIDFERSRGCETGEDSKKGGSAISGFFEVLKNTSLLVFTISVVLFHFANAAMLPLIGQKLSLGLYCRGTDSDDSGRVGGGALRALLGRKAVFLIGFAALPIRGALYTLSDNPYYLVGVQLMDGIGAAIFGVLSVLVIADLTRGTGRFNFTQGVVATATDLGASLSNSITGFIVQRAGFNVAFLFLAVVAAFV